MSLREQTSIPVAETETEVREQLYDQGYANIGIGISNSESHELFDSFKAFVALTKESGGESIKNAVAYKGRPEEECIGNESYYLEERVPGKHNPHESSSRAAGKDSKYVFHFGPRTIEHALKKLGSLPKEVDDLLEQCQQFYFDGRAAAKLGSAALGLESIFFHQDSTKELHHLRLLDYFSSDNGEHAEPHFDRGVTTLALNESHPGLRGLAVDNGYLRPLNETERRQLEAGLLPVSHQEGIGKYFASAGLRRLPASIRAENALDHIPLLAHGVVDEKPGVNRQASVMFFNPHLDYAGYPEIPSKEETSVKY